MTRIEVDYNRVPFAGAFSLSLRAEVVRNLHPGQIVELDGGEDVPVRRAEVTTIKDRRVRLRFLDTLRETA